MSVKQLISFTWGAFLGHFVVLALFGYAPWWPVVALLAVGVAWAALLELLYQNRHPKEPR